VLRQERTEPITAMASKTTVGASALHLQPGCVVQPGVFRPKRLSVARLNGIAGAVLPAGRVLTEESRLAPLIFGLGHSRPTACVAGNKVMYSP
jgi:hypothetical protein